MRRLISTLTATSLAALALAAPAQGAFGINNFDVTFTEADGTPAKAGSHPFAMTTSLGTDLDAELIPEGWLKDIFVEQIPGFVGDTTAYERCTSLEFSQAQAGGIPACSLESQVGIAGVSVTEAGAWEAVPVFNLTPPPGVLVRLGFRVLVQSVFIDAVINPNPPYNAVASSRNTSQLVNFFGSKFQLWGNPSDPAHDELRGACGRQSAVLPPGDIEGYEFQDTGESCPVDANPKPFLTMPTDCSEPLTSSFEAISWEGEKDAGSRLTHDTEGNPAPLFGCDELRFEPSISASPTSKAAHSPTGLDFSLDVKDEGLVSVEGRRHSDIKEAIVTLPEGMSANPSIAEGLEVCSEDDLDDETLSSAPGEGCPEASKIGTLEVETPLVEEPVKGALYQAAPYENLAEDSLLAFYIVFKNPNLGVIVKLPVKVEPDPKTGQLKAITKNIPQLPFSHFRLHFREGGRSPLITPPLCGTYEATAEMTPWSGGNPITATSAFEVISGPNEGPCPKGGTPPFEPGFEAGSQSNAAGSYSPFSMRLTRRDGDQDLTRFDATLPPGVVAKLAGVSRCSDAQIAQAKAKTGKAELASSSCPANSKIGSAIGGAGVGSQLIYVHGSVYLAGPFGGAPLSAVAIVPAVAGPFDIGTVVTRQALKIHPRTGVVTADGANSDPIPHILAGIRLPVRDIHVHVDRPNFTLNPTSCKEMATKASIWGGGTNLFSIVDDSPVQRQARYQAASCASLGFKPSLNLKLKGGTKRGAHPKLRSVYKPRKGDANLEGLVLRLPRSAFLDQGHIRTICTRVQFAAGGGSGAGCPAGAVYGRARAFTPLLDEPLEGPVYLRSSNHKLPDFVAALHGIIDVEAVARIDSKKGGIRATFTEVPDAPITKVVVNMQGGKKGLIVNSTNLCRKKSKANAAFDAHNGRKQTIKPLMRASCSKQGKSKRR